MSLSGLDTLRQQGLAFWAMPNVNLVHDDVLFEAPASVTAELSLAFPFRLGAFSHLNGGFIQNATIGRYCSFARDVQVGHGGHPDNWLSVSPLQYVPDYRGWMAFATRHQPLPPIQTRQFQYAQHTVIGNDVWIGNHAILKDGVTIGDGAIVGAGSIVIHDVPSYAIVAGNPARLIRMRFPDPLIERLQRLRWWQYSLAAFDGVDFGDIASAVSRVEDLVVDGLQPYVSPLITAADLRALSSAR